MSQEHTTQTHGESVKGRRAEPPATIPQILAYGVRSFPDRVAMRSCGSLPERSYTYAQVGRLAAAAARQLAARGVGKAAPVALLCENRPEWAIAYFAVHLSGGTCVPIDTKLTASECRAILECSRVRLVLASPGLLSAAAQAANGLPGVRVVAIDDLLGAAAARTAAPHAALPAGHEVAPDGVAVIAFTSGTTGSSKGVVLTHGNIASNAVSAARRMDGTADDRLLSVLPLSHLLEQTGGLLVPFLWGASITYAGTLNPRRLTEAVRQCGATIMLIVPAMARLFGKLLASVADTQAAPGALREAPLRGRFHNLFGERFRYFISGGAALDADLARSFLDVGVPLLQGYGLSEAAPLVSCNTLGEHVAGSVGRPFPGVEVKVRPAAGGDGHVGEILVRGPNVMAGYFEDPGATRVVFEDGWLCTGDLGRVDENGFLYVLGRVKDVIVGASGMNVYPEEVEARIGRSPYVREVCVLGVQPPGAGEHGEQVAALVVPDVEALGGEYTCEHEELLRRELRSACARLAGYKRPRYFAVCLEPFPRTTTMKLKKHEIRRRLDDTKLSRL